MLFGGAAGGGKSYAQIIDACIFALKYPGSRQLILRRTYPELEKSLIRTHLALYPKDLYKYSSAKHSGIFANKSIIDFGYLDNPNDVYKYQSAEYDVIRFDELTHFTEDMYLYLISRVRGVNGYPKQVKSTTNPGGIGHAWVKARFIDVTEPLKKFETPAGSRIFIPSLIKDNKFLMAADAGYIARLESLPEKEKRALLYGDWDIFDGQFFTEFSRAVHVCEPFEIPDIWRRYRCVDYGLDMLACYFIALDDKGKAYVYKEIYRSGLIVSEAAAEILKNTDERIYATFAPPDLWNRHKDTGRSTAEIFSQNGIPLTKVSNRRAQGWLDLKEWLKVREADNGGKDADMKIFSLCRNLIRTLPALIADKNTPGDVCDTPHELTHAPDALRYFAGGRPCPGRDNRMIRKYNFSCERPKTPGVI